MTANNVFDRLREWVKYIELMEDTDSISINELKGEIYRLERVENSKMTDIITLKLVSSYLDNVIDPQPSIALDDLAHLHPEDLIDYEIPKELFTMAECSKDDVQKLSDLLSEVIIKMEEKKIDNI